MKTASEIDAEISRKITLLCKLLEEASESKDIQNTLKLLYQAEVLSSDIKFLLPKIE